MAENISQIIHLAGGPVEFLVLAGVFSGVLIAVMGARAFFAPIDATERRLLMPKGGRARSSVTVVPLRQNHDGGTAIGFSRFISPIDPRERKHIQQQLVRAGFRGDQAFATYYLVRAILGLVLPLPLVLGALAASATAEAAEAVLPIMHLDMSSSMMLACLMLVVGFYGPPLWLRRRIAARQRAISDGFPHALDMMQVSIEAGLGFDSALARVAGELKRAHPAIAEEFAIVGLELRAGKARDQVLDDGRPCPTHPGRGHFCLHQDGSAIRQFRHQYCDHASGLCAGNAAKAHVDGGGESQSTAGQNVDHHGRLPLADDLFDGAFAGVDPFGSHVLRRHFPGRLRACP